jgi:hypothetical protein
LCFPFTLLVIPPTYVCTHEHTTRARYAWVYSPGQVLDAGGALRLNDKYYCAKMIVPALHRCLSLVGAAHVACA